jgi:DNA-binding LacI/PurR family transcriptional regulator
VLLEHLFALGHREIRFISGDPNNRNTHLRNEAFRTFLRRHGLPGADSHIHYPMVEIGRRALGVFLRLRDAGKRSTPHERLQTTLIVRRSTDPNLPPFIENILTTSVNEP